MLNVFFPWCSHNGPKQRERFLFDSVASILKLVYDFNDVTSDPVPRRGIPGTWPPNDFLCPPKRKLCPPSENCAPKKLTGLGLQECKSRPQLVFATGIFVIFVDWHRILWHIWDEDLFLSFFWDRLFSVEKSLWIFGLHLVHLIQTGTNFSCPVPLSNSYN